jgi:hypothetical protein
MKRRGDRAMRSVSGADGVTESYHRSVTDLHTNPPQL